MLVRRFCGLDYASEIMRFPSRGDARQRTFAHDPAKAGTADKAAIRFANENGCFPIAPRTVFFGISQGRNSIVDSYAPISV
jgi:hypothetical protein